VGVGGSDEMKTLAKILGAFALALIQAVAQNPDQPVNTPTHLDRIESSGDSDTIRGFPIHEVNPSYPGKARKKDAQGKIVLRATIAADGSLKDVSVQSGDSSLTAAAVDAVRGWRYIPDMRDGSPIESQTTVTLEYDLRKRASRPENPPPGVPTAPSEDLLTEFATGKLCRVGGAVKAPKSIYTPDPEYSEAARQAKFQGTDILGLVVGPDGLPRDVWIVRGLGEGLDEKSIETVEKWRFEPATKDGEPVAVPLNIEISFRLY
jgi:TonB family protein